ncbi:MAG: FlgD immunoglobulin-like domain containing protein [bacterium]
MKYCHRIVTVCITPALAGLLTLLIVLPTNVDAQTFSVKGIVATPTMSVRYASMTFIDKNDTTKKVSVLTDTSGRYAISLLTSVRSNATQPAEFELEQNYPNPFSSSTAISYQLKEQTDVKVTIYDLLGRTVKIVSMSDQAAGAHGIMWDGRNNLGEIVSRGIYFYKLQARGETQVRKMLFGWGGNNSLVSIAGTPAPKLFALSKEMRPTLLGGNFLVRIGNSDSTFPAIVAQQFDTITVQNTGTQDFTVNTNGTFPIPNTPVIYFDSPLQVIRGFGGANILQWRDDMTMAQVQKAFGSGTGQIGFSILRLRVPYDPSGTAFSMQIPTAKLAQSLGAIVFASPWTPPPAMKSNNNIVGGTLKESSYAEYAAYLKSFADYMAANGAPLYAISLQNEPDANVTYESCSWNGTQFLNFMKNNAASIGTRIMMPESQNFVHALSDPTLNDSAATANVAIIAGHLYGGGLGTYPLATSKGKEIWMTEYLDLDTTWTGVLGTGKQINDCMKAGWNAYVWWYTVRYYGPIDENGNVSKRGYAMSQYARFVRPGFTRVNVTDYYARTLVDVTAYRNGPKLVIVAVNRASTVINHTFTLWNGTIGTFTPYVTSSSKNCVQQSDIKYKNGSFTFSLEPLSVTTFVSN